MASNSGVEYLFIPVDGGGLRPRILVLRADDLSCVAHDEVWTFGTNSVGWVAVPGNQLFTSEGTIDATHPTPSTSSRSTGACCCKAAASSAGSSARS